MRYVLMLLMAGLVYAKYTFVPQIGHSSYVNAIAISPDGRYIVSGSWDGTIKVWDMGEGRLLITMVADADGNWAVGTPDGRWDANEGGKRYVGIRHERTLEGYTPGDEVCERFHYSGLLSYVWSRGELPGKQL